MWLASISLRDEKQRIVPTSKWTLKQQREADQRLDEVLAGVGDKDRQRALRMNVTRCRHRGVTPEEAAGLPDRWKRAPPGLAGGPVEVLWVRGVPDNPGGRPCEAPGRDYLPGERPGSELWIPRDCGRCEPCRARLAVERESLAQTAGAG